MSKKYSNAEISKALYIKNDLNAILNLVHENQVLRGVLYDRIKEKEAPIEDKPQRIVDWMTRKGKESATIRDLVAAKIPGCTTAKLTRVSCQELIDQGKAVWVEPAYKKREIMLTH